MSIIANAMTKAVDRINCLNEWKKKASCKKHWPGKPQELAVALIAHGESESHFAKRVHEGNCKPWECDPVVWWDKKGNKRIAFRARNVFQIQATRETHFLWQKSLGSSLMATANAAYVQAYYLSRRYCKGNIVHMFEAQSGKGCKNGKLGRKKAELYWKYLRVYNRESQKKISMNL